MSPVTAATLSPPVTVLCSRALPVTMIVTIAPTSVGLAASDHHDVVWPPQLILRDTMRGSVGLTTLSQQQQNETQMPSQVYVNYAMGPSQVSFQS